MSLPSGAVFDSGVPGQVDLHNDRVVAELTDLAQRLLDEARRQGAPEAEVSVTDRTGLSVGVRQRDVESVELNQDRSIALSVIVDCRRGMVSTTDTRSSSIAEAVAKAVNFARHTQQDPCNGLADPDRLAKHIPDLDLYHPEALDAERQKADALEAEATALDFDSRIVNSNGSSAWSQSGCEVYANTHGFLGSTRGTQYGMSVGVVAQDERGMQTDGWYTTSRLSGELESPQVVGNRAARRSLRRLGGRRVTTGSYPVVFDAQTAKSLLGSLVAALSGGLLYRKASFLADSIDTMVAAEGFSLWQRPHLQRAGGSCAFDAEGVATKDLCFIERGVVRSYVLDSYTSRKLKLPTTGNAGGVFNLELEVGTTPLSDLLGSIESGFLVTEMMGQGINLVTGDYSRGAAGLWIENGEPAFPVDEVTVAGNLQRMLRGLSGYGDDTDVRGNIRTGSILVEGMTVAAG